MSWVVIVVVLIVFFTAVTSSASQDSEEHQCGKKELQTLVAQSEYSPSRNIFFQGVRYDGKDWVSSDDAHYIGIDTDKRLVIIDHSAFTYGSLLSVELISETRLVSSGGIGRAVVGTAIAGGAGAVVGAATAKQNVVDEPNGVRIYTAIIDCPMIELHTEPSQCREIFAVLNAVIAQKTSSDAIAEPKELIGSADMDTLKERTCSQCGCEVGGNAKFCANCGAMLPPVPKPEPLPKLPASEEPQQSSTDAEVAEKAAQEEQELARQRSDEKTRNFFILIGMVAIIAIFFIVLAVNNSSSSAASSPSPTQTIRQTSDSGKTTYSSYTISDFKNYVETCMKSEPNLKGCYKVQTKGDSLTIWLTFDGMAETMLYEQLAGSTETHDSMDKSIKDLCVTFYDIAVEEGLDDCSVMVALLNDVNTENTLLAYINGIKVSDFLN